jgi:hypothetical protein
MSIWTRSFGLVALKAFGGDGCRVPLPSTQGSQKPDGISVVKLLHAVDTSLSSKPAFAKRTTSLKPKCPNLLCQRRTGSAL